MASQTTAANTNFNSARMPRELPTDSRASGNEQGANGENKRVSFTSQNSMKSPQVDMTEQFPDAARSARIPSSEDNGIGALKGQGWGWAQS